MSDVRINSGDVFKRRAEETRNSWVLEQADLFPIEPDAQFFVILNGRRVAAYASTCDLHERGNNQRTIRLDYIYVHGEQRNQGHATSLVRAIFGHVARDKNVLWPSKFLPMGAQYLMPVMPRIHAEYPDLEIIWGRRTPVSGHVPYQLDLPAWKSDPVTFAI